MGAEELLELVLLTALREADLGEVAEEAGVAALTDGGGQPVAIERVASLHDDGFMTSSRGVVVELSDASTWTLSVACHRPPRGGC